MSVNSSRVSTLPDAEQSVVLRDVNSGAETSTYTETPVKLSEVSGYWQDKALPSGQLRVTVDVTALDRSNGDESYTISLRVDDTSDHSNAPITIASISPVATGSYVLGVNLDSLNIALPTASALWLAVRLQVSGTTPSIQFGAVASRV